MIETTAEVRKVPKWAVGLVIALAIVAGGWFVWRSLFSDAVHESGVIKGMPTPIGTLLQPGWQMRAPPPPAAGSGGWLSSLAASVQRTDGVFPAGQNQWTVRSGEIVMGVNQAAGQAKPILAARYTSPTFLARDQRRLVQARNRVTGDPNLIKSFNLSDDQVKKLRGARLNPDMQLDDASKTKLQALWQAYQAAGLGAAQDAAKKSLLAGLADVGKTSADASRVAAKPALDQIQSVLTPQQIDQVTAKPATAPAARPATRAG